MRIDDIIILIICRRICSYCFLWFFCWRISYGIAFFIYNFTKM